MLAFFLLASSMAVVHVSAWSLGSLLPSALHKKDLSTLPCSGNGILSDLNVCVCDVGFAGNECEREVSSLEETDDLSSATTNLPRVAMFFDSFDTFRPETGRAEANVQLAATLAGQGYNVTVYVNGFQENAKLSYGNITLHALPHTGIVYTGVGASAFMARSLDVYRHLRSHSYKIVYFEMESGMGYVPLQARRQNLLVGDTRFVVGAVSNAISSDPITLTTAPEMTLLQHMRSKSLEYADLAIYDHAEYQSNPDIGSVLSLTIPGKAQALCAQHNPFLPIRELVFVGELSADDDLVTFVDALDLLHATVESVAADDVLNITFLGPVEANNASEPLQFIQRRSAVWHKFNVEVRSSPLHSTPIISYLTSGGKDTANRAVIIGTQNIPLGLSNVTSTFLLGEVVLCGVPVLVSNLPQNSEILDAAQCPDTLFTPGDVNDLLRLMRKALDQQQASTCTITSATKNAAQQFSQAMKDLALRHILQPAPSQTSPLVSIILVHSRTKNLGDLQRSLKSIESQQYTNYDVTLVAESGDQDSNDYVQQLSLKWWEERGWRVVTGAQGDAAKMYHAGLSQATGKYVTVLETADVAKRNLISTLVARAEESKADFVLAAYDLVTPVPRRFIPLGSNLPVLLAYNTSDRFLANTRVLTELVGNGEKQDLFHVLLDASAKDWSIESVIDPLMWRSFENDQAAHQLQTYAVSSLYIQRGIKTGDLAKRGNSFDDIAEAATISTTDTTDTASMTTTDTASMTTTDTVSMTTTDTASMTTTDTVSMTTTDTVSMTTTDTASMTTTDTASMTTTVTTSMTTDTTSMTTATTSMTTGTASMTTATTSMTTGTASMATATTSMTTGTASMTTATTSMTTETSSMTTATTSMTTGTASMTTATTSTTTGTASMTTATTSMTTGTASMTTATTSTTTGTASMTTATTSMTTGTASMATATTSMTTGTASMTTATTSTTTGTASMTTATTSMTTGTASMATATTSMTTGTASMTTATTSMTTGTASMATATTSMTTGTASMTTATTSMTTETSSMTTATTSMTTGTASMTTATTSTTTGTASMATATTSMTTGTASMTTATTSMTTETSSMTTATTSTTTGTASMTTGTASMTTASMATITMNMTTTSTMTQTMMTSTTTIVSMTTSNTTTTLAATSTATNSTTAAATTANSTTAAATTARATVATTAVVTTAAQTTTSSIIVVQTPAPLPAIQLVVQGPSLLSGCDGANAKFTVDLSFSYGSALRFFYYYTGSVSNITTILAAVNGTSATSVIIPSSLVALNSSMSFQVVAMDSGNSTSSAVYTVQKVNDVIPLLQIDEGPFLSVFYSDSPSLTARAVYPACLNGSTPVSNITWRVTYPSGTVTNFNTSQLNLVGSKMGYGSTTAVAFLTVNNTTLNATSTIYVASSPLTGWIDGGTLREVSLQAPTTLQAMWQDTDKPSQTTYNFVWRCATAGSSGCLSSYPNTQTITIHNTTAGSLNSLLASTYYFFSVDITDPYVSGRSSVGSTAAVYTIATAIPSIVITRFPSDRLVSSTNDITLFSAVMYSGVVVPANQVTYLWSISPTSATNISLATLPKNSALLTLPANTLLSGQSYSFRVNATVKGIMSSSDIAVQMSIPPSGGWIHVNNTSNDTSLPTFGYALTDTFSISTGGWQGSSTPFLYTLGCTGTDGNNVFFSYSSSQTTLTNMRLAATCVSVFADATDTASNVVRVRVPVNITQQVLSASQSTALQSNLLSTMASASSISDVLSNMNVLLGVTQATSQGAGVTDASKQEAAAAQVQALTFFSAALTATTVVDQKLAVRSMSVIASFDVTAVNATVLSSSFSMFEKLISGGTVVGSKIVSMPMSMASQATQFISKLLRNPSVATQRSSSLLGSRQVDPAYDTRIRTNVQGISQGLVAGDSCRVPGTAKSVVETSFELQGRRISSTGTEHTDSIRQIGNFSVGLPPVLPASCFDVHYVSWEKNGTAGSGVSNITSNVLTAQLYYNGTRSVLDTTSLQLSFNVSVNSTTASSTTTLQCVYNNGTSWTKNSCVTTIINSTLVSCQCPFYTDFAVHSEALSTTTTTTAASSPTSTGTTTTTSSSNGAAIGGGIAAGIVVIGGAAGYMFYRRRAA